MLYILFNYRSDSLVFHFGVFHGLPSLYITWNVNIQRKINDLIDDIIIKYIVGKHTLVKRQANPSLFLIFSEQF